MVVEFVEAPSWALEKLSRYIDSRRTEMTAIHVIEEEVVMGLLRELKVASACKWNDELPRLARNLPLQEAVGIIAKYEETCFPVVDENNQLIGLVSHDHLLNIEREFMGRVLIVDDVRSNLLTVTPSEDIRSALDKLIISGYKEVLVVDEGDPNKVLGTLSQLDLMTAFDGEFFR